jgi:hypothetical protein
MNYPIARDVRLKLRWRKSESTGRWLCDVPGADQIQLRLPGDVPSYARRCPSALAVNVLFLLLGEAKKCGTATIEFASTASILRLLGYGVEARNRQKVKEALTLWSDLMIRFNEWYVPTRYRYVEKDGTAFDVWRKGRQPKFVAEPERVARQLPPPIRSLDLKGRRIQIVIDSEWIKFGRSYFTRVSLPLPREAAAQNLVLALLTSHSWTGDYGEKQTYHRWVRKLCRKIGLNHGDRNLSLERAIDVARDWFERRGIDLACHWPVGEPRLRFVLIRRKLFKQRSRREAAREDSKRPMTDPDVRVLETMTDPDGNR